MNNDAYQAVRERLKEVLVDCAPWSPRNSTILDALDGVIAGVEERETWLLERIRDQEAAIRELMRIAGGPPWSAPHDNKEPSQ